MDRFTLWGSACVLVGLCFLVSALRIYLSRKSFLAVVRSASGTVVDVRVEGIGRNAVSRPLLEFHTVEGALHRAESLLGSGLRGFRVGEAVAVRYDPADPSRAEVDAFVVLWGLALLRCGFAALFLVMGLVALST